MSTNLRQLVLDAFSRGIEESAFEETHESRDKIIAEVEEALNMYESGRISALQLYELLNGIADVYGVAVYETDMAEIKRVLGLE